VDLINKKLVDRGYSSEALHGDIVQKQREKILQDFKNKKTMILVATDVAAWGIEVENLTHVINFSLPHDLEYYVHRIGKTCRAGNEGMAITFVTPEEYKRLSFIKRIAKTDIRRERIPDVKEIISIKKDRISEELKNLIDNEHLDYYKDLSGQIIGDMDKDTAIAALLKYSFADELDINNYSNIKELNLDKKDRINIDAKTRLFITIGKKENITPRKRPPHSICISKRKPYPGCVVHRNAAIDPPCLN